MTSRWDCPHEWLLEKIEHSRPSSLRSLSRKLAMKLDHDAIQELFQEEMDDDGYFDGVWELDYLPVSQRDKEFVEAQMMLKEIAGSAAGISLSGEEK